MAELGVLACGCLIGGQAFLTGCQVLRDMANDRHGRALCLVALMALVMCCPDFVDILPARQQGWLESLYSAF